MTEPEQRTIAEILDAIEESWTDLAGVLASLTPEQWHLPTGCPGWDVQDVASHIIGLEDRFAGVPEPEHELPEGLAHVRGADGIEMEVAVDFRRGVPSAEILEQFRVSTARGLRLRRESDRPADELTDGPFGWRMPYWQLLSVRTFDCFAHEQDIRRAVGQPGNLDSLAARVTGDLIETFLPGLLHSRVPELEHREILIAIDDSAGHPRRIVAGTAAPDEPTTTATMPFSEFIALVTGRADVKRELITITGEEEFAQQVLKSLAVTP